MLSSRVKYAILVLAELENAGRSGQRLTVSEIKERCGINPRSGFDSRGISMAICTLRRKRWVENSNSRHYIVADLTRATLYDLVMAVDEGVYMGDRIAEGLSLKIEDRYARVMELNREIEENVTKQLREIRLCDLFLCGEKKPAPKRNMIRENELTPWREGHKEFFSRFADYENELLTHHKLKGMALKRK